MKKIISYTSLIGMTISILLLMILSGAGSKYIEGQKIAVAGIFLFFSVLIGLWHLTSFRRNKPTHYLPSGQKLLASFFVGLFSIVALSTILIFFISEEQLAVFVIENPYIAFSILAGAASAYYSSKMR